MVLAGVPGLTLCTGKHQTGKGGRGILAHGSVVMQAPRWICQGAWKGCAGGREQQHSMSTAGTWCTGRLPEDFRGLTRQPLKVPPNQTTV